MIYKSGSRSRWSSLEQSFVEYFAGGENTVEAALNELRQLKQGPTRMVVFGQQLREVARRAGIHSDKMLIGYLKTAVNSEMTKAIIYRGPSTYGQAVNICIEVETDLLHLADTKVSYTPGYVNLNVRHTEREEKTTEIQNYQEKYNRGKLRDMRNIRCYKCQKMGHMKRDCRVKTTDRKGYYDKQNQQDLESDNREVKAEEIYKEPDTNIFSQFFQSNNNAEIDEKRTTDVNRFKLTVSTGHGDESVLIDTGSTIGSISETVAASLGLERYSCPTRVIRYGNSSTQMTNQKAVFKFKFNNEKSTAHLYVVQKQNERIILGMDWMIMEDIVLHPGSRQISKAKICNVNNADMVEELLYRHSGLTEESEFQTITNAPYKHRIDTGDSLPSVTRDYRRSEMENQAINKEVQKMLKKKVIVPSSSDWCSPVVLIKKPDERQVPTSANLRAVGSTAG
ncbi:hypothetical protein G6F57_015291 [Rhizopus arrhizus]|nr:hypothetical protein G6F57_015291 [Rhizopus arrhizus]